MSVCKSCGAAIKWVEMADTNRKMPLDIVPVVFISIEADGKGVTHSRYTSHFATCPDTYEHRGN